MPWRWVGLQGEDGLGEGIRKVRVTEDGELFVRVTGGGGGGGGDGSVVLEGIDTDDILSVHLADESLLVDIASFPAGQQLAVSLADITTLDQLTVKIAEALSTLPVQIVGADGNLPVVINASTTSLTTTVTDIDVSSPVPVDISSAEPVSVTVAGPDPLPVEISSPVSVTVAGPDPLPVILDAPNPVPVSITGEPVSVELTGDPVEVTVVGGESASSGPVDESGFGGDPRSVTGPAADAVITNHYPGVAGELHLIEITAWFSEGTPLAADNYNMAFKFGGTVISKIPVALALNIPVTSRFYFKSATGTPFGVHAVGAGSSGVTYNAFLTATRLV